ncbi:MAG: EF-hand domain-containing protein [Devosia sp.]
MTKTTKRAAVIGTVIVAAVGTAAVAQTAMTPAQGMLEAGTNDALIQTSGEGWRGRWFGHRGKHRGMRAMMPILRKADTNRDRALTQEEIDTFVAGQVAEADTDGDGNLSLEEFRTVWLSITGPVMVDSFQMLDDDGNGIITVEERDERFGDAVSRFDRNGDGQLSRADRRGKHHRGHRGDRDDDRDDD